MSAGEIDLQPDVEDVLQAEPAGYEPTVKVCLEKANTPIRTQALPRKAGATFSRTITTKTTQILFADHRRASVTLMSIGQNMYVALNPASAEDLSKMALWPANVPCPVTATTDVWVASATSTTVVSALTELWATGDGDDGRGANKRG